MNLSQLMQRYVTTRSELATKQFCFTWKGEKF